MFSKPSFKNFFGPEIRKNIVNRYGEYQVREQDVITEGVYYAVDMCIEFQRKSEGLLTHDWVEHISKEVYSAINQYVFDLNISQEEFVQRVYVHTANLSNAKTLVDRYYNRI